EKENEDLKPDVPSKTLNNTQEPTEAVKDKAIPEQTVPNNEGKVQGQEIDKDAGCQKLKNLWKQIRKTVLNLNKWEGGE
ncbi:MAG: hypothetical protein ACOC4Z_01605, partial [Patescibacteria group bacterium]